MKNYTKSKLIALIFLFVVPLTGIAQYSEKKAISKSFKIAGDEKVTIKIENKYGKVHVNTWDADSVRFEVEIIATSKSNDRLKGILNLIKVDFTHTSYFVTAKTNFKNYKNKFWQDITDLANSIFSSGGNIEVNFKVSLPENVKLIIKNKFGNVYLNDFDGDLRLELSNGDFQANDLTGYSDITIGFGAGYISYVKNGRLKINYADLDLDVAGSVEFETRSSEMRIGKASVLQINSIRDEYFITSVKTINGKASFSKIYIDKINKKAKLKTRYGNTNVELHSSCNVDLNSYYTDINIYVSSKIYCQCEIVHTEKTDIFYPATYKMKKKKVEKPVGDKKYKTYGLVGNSSGTKAKINISITGGNVKLLEK